MLVIDVGTSSMRGVLFNGLGQKLDIQRRHYSPLFLDHGKVEQDPRSWIEALEDILLYYGNTTKTKKETISCIALTAARSSVIPVDNNGIPLHNAIMWQDRRSASIVEQYNDYHNTIYDKTGMLFSTLVSASKILWIKAHYPALYEKTRFFIGIQDLLVHYLTGNFVTDYSFGSRTAIMNLETKEWDEQLLDLYKLDTSKLCTLIPSGSVCGNVMQSVASKTNLPANIPVVSAGGDQQCAALGQGLSESNSLVINTGTGAYILKNSYSILLDTSRKFFCNASAISGHYTVEASILSAGILYNWFVKFLSHNGSSATTYKNATDIYTHINTSVENTPTGSHGVLFLPWIAGRGAPFWNSNTSGSFLNLSFNSTTGDFARAILEGIALEIKENKMLMETLTEHVSTISVAGGMSEFSAYNQMLSDCLGAEIVYFDEPESTAVGAWIVATKTMKTISSHNEGFDIINAYRKKHIYTPDKNNFTVYEQILEKRKKVYSVFCENELW